MLILWGSFNNMNQVLQVNKNISIQQQHQIYNTKQNKSRKYTKLNLCVVT